MRGRVNAIRTFKGLVADLRLLLTFYQNTAKIQKYSMQQDAASIFFVPLQYENRNYRSNGQGVYTAQIHS